MKSLAFVVTVLLLCVLALTASSSPTRAQQPTWVDLHDFAGADGSRPDAALLEVPGGYMYGTTARDVNDDPNSFGTVFVISPDGALSTIYTFSGPDGQEPIAPLMMGPAALYGTTVVGGATGNGTVFQVVGDSVQNIYSFEGAPGDGQYPWDPLFLASDGNFYLTTQLGGGNAEGDVGEFNLGPPASSSFVCQFLGGNGTHTPYFPSAGLIEPRTPGVFYTATQGDSTNHGSEVISVDTSGNLAKLHQLTGVDGSDVNGTLVANKGGTIFGGTVFGGPGWTGPATGDGVIFKINTANQYSIIHKFSGTDGSAIYAPLIIASDGNLYGVAHDGGAFGFGSIFRMAQDGSNFTDLHDFSGSTTDGANPYGGLIQASDLNIYGTTQGGGANGFGTVFRLDLAPVIQSVTPNKSPNGTFIHIFGTGLLYTTKVTFAHNVPATFQVASDTDLVVLVPNAAVTGNITVATPIGKATTTQAFVIPKPSITSIVPSHVAHGSPDTTVTVNGNDFSTAAVVEWNGAQLTTGYNSINQLFFIIPAGDLTTVGTATITVVNPNGATSNAKTFKIT